MSTRDEQVEANQRGSCARLSVGEHPLGDNPHFNEGNRRLYCAPCAEKINAYNMLGRPLCTPTVPAAPTRTADEIDAMSPSECWEIYVGDESAEAFMALSGLIPEEACDAYVKALAREALEARNHDLNVECRIALDPDILPVRRDKARKAIAEAINAAVAADTGEQE